MEKDREKYPLNFYKKKYHFVKNITNSSYLKKKSKINFIYF